MPYITGEELFRRYPIMRSWGFAPQSADADLIPYAEAELNGLLSGAFAVPIAGGDKSYSVKDLAIELSYCKALFTKDPKQWEQRHKAILDRIAGIVAGKEALSDVGSGMASSVNEAWSTTMDYAPVHGMADAQDSRIDPYQLRDEKDRRGFTDGETP
jgi:hypothetical protein